MKLLDLKTWDRLSQDDLTHNDVRHASLSPQLQEFQERLRRKRYIDDAIEDVRAVFLVAAYLICVVPGICAAPGDLDPFNVFGHIF
jgi:hypothetical protein